jgi:methylated-DNA-[protein]-cysteine S-methyltransferase
LLSGYFAGKVKRFSVPLDIGNVTPFTRKVLQACYRIPFGKVVTYGELARMAGRPKASRAVGQVMAHNRIAIVIPCHRVVGSDKGLHGFGGGLEMKRRLLELEGVKVRNGKICQ